MVHFTSQYILNPEHKITITLIGCGGTGTNVLGCLARMNEALLGIGHPGIHVYCYDNDTVTESNIGRQIFSPADIGINKAVCLVSRINRFFGTDWEAEPELFTGQKLSNLYISCIDTAKGRIELKNELVKLLKSTTSMPYQIPFYWMDFGNSKNTGQVIIGTINTIKQPKSEYKTSSTLPDVIKKFPGIKKIKDDETGPNCSMAEALFKQDLFINSTLANLGMNILWKMFKEGFITYQGCYLNLQTMTVNPIHIQ